MNVKDLKFYVYDKGIVRVDKPDGVTVHYDETQNNYMIEVSKTFKTTDNVLHSLTYKDICTDNAECSRLGVIDGKVYNQFYWVGKNAKQVKEFLTLIRNKLADICKNITETIDAVDVLLE